jgi:hypothetical protein
MQTNLYQTNHKKLLLCRMAWMINLLTLAIWLFSILDTRNFVRRKDWVGLSWEMLLLISLVTISTLSILLGYKRECVGGGVLIFWGFALMVLAFKTSGPGQFEIMMISAVSFLISGPMLMGCEWIQKLAP